MVEVTIISSKFTNDNECWHTKKIPTLSNWQFFLFLKVFWVHLFKNTAMYIILKVLMFYYISFLCRRHKTCFRLFIRFVTDPVTYKAMITEMISCLIIFSYWVQKKNGNVVRWFTIVPYHNTIQQHDQYNVFRNYRYL